MSVKVDVEYCGLCGEFRRECEELSKIIKTRVPDAQVRCHKGRKGAFEVRINNTMVFSKLSESGFPNKHIVAAKAKDASEGKPVMRNISEMPKAECVIQ